MAVMGSPVAVVVIVVVTPQSSQAAQADGIEEKKNGKTKEINQPDPARDWRLPTSANPASRLGGSFLHGDRLCLRMPTLQRPSGTARRSRFLRFRAS